MFQVQNWLSRGQFFFLQLERNNCLRRVADLLKKQDKSKADSVVIEWQLEESKSREVKIGSVVAFRQEVGETSGKFLKDFAHLRL